MSSREDDTDPFEPSGSSPEEEHNEIMEGVQDSNEDTEDYDQENEKDEGSLYAPSEATSELGSESSNEDEDSMELSAVGFCMFLMRLPRELRDKVRPLLQISVYGPTI